MVPLSNRFYMYILNILYCMWIFVHIGIYYYNSVFIILLYSSDFIILFCANKGVSGALPLIIGCVHLPLKQLLKDPQFSSVHLLISPQVDFSRPASYRTCLNSSVDMTAARTLHDNPHRDITRSQRRWGSLGPHKRKMPLLRITPAVECSQHHNCVVHTCIYIYFNLGEFFREVRSLDSECSGWFGKQPQNESWAQDESLISVTICLYQGEKYDGRKADAWSCGVILFALLVVSNRLSSDTDIKMSFWFFIFFLHRMYLQYLSVLGKLSPGVLVNLILLK